MRRWSLLLVAALVCACERRRAEISADPSARVAPSARPPAEETYLVYSAAMTDAFAPFRSRGDRLIVVSETVPAECGDRAHVEGAMPTAHRETLDALLAPGAKSALENRFAVSGFRVDVIDPKTFDGLFAVGTAPGLMQRSFPGMVGVLQLAPVAFDGVHGDAMVYAILFQDVGLSRGLLIHLVKHQGRWTSREVIRCWIS